MKGVVGNIVMFAKELNSNYCLGASYRALLPVEPARLRAVKSIPPHDSIFNL